MKVAVLAAPFPSKFNTESIVITSSWPVRGAAPMPPRPC